MLWGWGDFGSDTIAVNLKDRFSQAFVSASKCTGGRMVAIGGYWAEALIMAGGISHVDTVSAGLRLCGTIALLAFGRRSRRDVMYNYGF